MSYQDAGKQYIVVAVSGGKYPGEYIAFALSDSEIRPAGQGRQLQQGLPGAIGLRAGHGAAAIASVKYYGRLRATNSGA
jgi:hypothetical protein